MRDEAPIRGAAINDSVTLELKGTVPLDLYASAISAFSALISALTSEVAAGKRISWVVEELEGGSAKSTFVGESEDIAAVEKVVHAYESVADAASHDKVVPYSDNVRREVRRLESVLNGKVTGIAMYTKAKAFPEIASRTEPTAKPTELREANFGAVEGVIDTISQHRGLKFTLYDALYGRAVACTLEPGQEDIMRNNWGKRAIIQGLVYRDRITGRPTAIKDVARVIPVIPGDFRRAGGILRGIGKDEPAESLIRRLRDA